MTQDPIPPDPASAPTSTPVPADDPNRRLTVARPDHDQRLPHLGLVGDTYTILIAGSDTNGAYTLIDMHVPPGGGPPPHRHDFEEMFSVLEGEVEVTFRGEKLIARAGETINVPANSPHGFRNAGEGPARLLCMCAPAGQDEFFTLVGEPVATRTQPPQPLDAAAQAAFVAKAQELAPRFRTELLPPPGVRPGGSGL
ncbi:cupin domain-containing protein [Streptomyces sp. CBMA29]|uniref:cupin domain-containing protein n=1 Tax=Streptomyces sp. CBMA29 TaxID=1896314 RepID=UPI001661CE57|nr:cupin domain-containing protein [Streptomyces sp. CBMA29]MBD0739112.1 cupin [Streptomyces sp. CBMA29]